MFTVLTRDPRDPFTVGDPFEPWPIVWSEPNSRHFPKVVRQACQNYWTCCRSSAIGILDYLTRRLKMQVYNTQVRKTQVQNRGGNR